MAFPANGGLFPGKQGGFLGGVRVVTGCAPLLKSFVHDHFSIRRVIVALQTQLIHRFTKQLPKVG